MLNTCAAKMLFQFSALVLCVEIIDEPFVVLRLLKPNPMKCFLEINWTILAPNRGAPWITAFANQNVAFDYCVLIPLALKESHLEQVRQVEGEPTNVDVSQVKFQLTFVLRFVEHLSERVFGNFRDSSYHPSFAALNEDGLEVAFEQSTRVLEILFGVGFGSGD